MERPVLLLLVLGVLALLAGCSGLPNGVTTPTPTAHGDAPPDLTIEERWTAGTSEVEGNHHAVAAGRVDGEPVVVAPIGGRRGATGCRLLALNGDGEERWRVDIEPDACTIHAVADPALADWVGDDQPEVLAATTERQVVAYDVHSGEPVFTRTLSNYGYTEPVVADVTGNGERELVVSDVDGELSVLRPNGSTVWTRELNAFSWSTPAVRDFDADADVEIVLGLGDGTALAFESDGSRAWTASVDGSVTWTAYGHVDGDETPEFVLATTEGTVAALNGEDGTVAWSRDLGRLAAVQDIADADGDGEMEVYATARDGHLRALAGDDGTVEWTKKLTAADVQMTPPPVVGDVTGDETLEIVAVTNDGRVLIVAPDGAVLATYARDAAIYTHATLADTDGDGAEELYVMYGDGTVAALSVSSE